MARPQLGSTPFKRPAPNSRPARWLIAVLLTMSVCYRDARPPCDNPPPIYVTVEADPRLNSDERNRSLPTQFLVLQLKAGPRFEKADFDDVWQRAKDSLGDELLQSNEMTVVPGATTTVGFPRQSGTTLVALVGIFRKHHGTAWRAKAELDPAPSNRCTAQPVPVPPKPGRDDLELKFHAEDVSIQNRTPPPPIHSGCS